MKILAIDSTSKPVSVCITDNGKIISEMFLNNKLTHSQTLMPMTKAVLKNSEISIQDIDLFAVSTGPGSFTGVRIGVSMVKGMALPYNKPCISVSTLESMAYNFLQTDCVVCATMDARCQQIYNAMFEIKGGTVKRLTEDRIILIDDLIGELRDYEKKIFFVGDGANLCYNKSDKELETFVLAPEFLMYQRASSVAMAATVKYQNNEITDALSLRPIYLQLCQAQRELESRGVKQW